MTGNANNNLALKWIFNLMKISKIKISKYDIKKYLHNIFEFE